MADDADRHIAAVDCLAGARLVQVAHGDTGATVPLGDLRELVQDAANLLVVVRFGAGEVRGCARGPAGEAPRRRC
jgi:hypothetical protein